MTNSRLNTSSDPVEAKPEGAPGNTVASAEGANETERVSIQEVWDAAGGNPGITPTRSDLFDALKMLDRVCDEAALRTHGAGEAWQPIETAPRDRREMYVVRGFNVTNQNAGARNYTTDPYCVFPGLNGGWVRWPHPFPPTHWMPLPPAPAALAAQAAMLSGVTAMGSAPAPVAQPRQLSKQVSPRA